MLILEIGNDYICFIDKKNQKISKISLGKEMIDEGNIINIPEIFGIIKNRVDVDNENEIAFILNSNKILSKEVSYPNTRNSKLKVLIGLSIKEHFKELINEEHVYSYEVLEKTRVLIYAIPKNIIDACFLIANMLEMKVNKIDYCDNVLVKYIKSKSKSQTNLFINIKENITVISILKDGIIKLQSTINNGDTISLISSASRIIKYYSDKNNKEHISRMFFYNQNKSIENFSAEISDKMKLEVVEIEERFLFKQNLETGTLNFAENSEIKDKGISKYFSIYRLSIIFSIGIFLYFIAPPTLNYIYAVSEKKEIQGDFDAIDDIIDIMNEEEISKKKLETAKIYESILATLPEDTYEITVKVNQEKIIINGSYKTNINELDIKKAWENSILVLNDDSKTFEIQSILGGEEN